MTALSECGLANEITVVNDGAEGLDYLHRRGKYAGMPPGNPAVVLLDLKVHKLGGLEVLRAIRRTPALRLVPVVILSSSREEGDFSESYHLGANAYVVKPVDLQAFVDAVKKTGLFWAALTEPPPGTVQR